jgi:putative spermidine/putrescine transport system permease protein
MTATAVRVDSAPAAAVKRRRRSLGWLPVVPLLAFTALAFGVPAWAVLDGAFTAKATGAFSTANLTASLQGAYLTALLGSVKLSAVSAVLAAVFGLSFV